MSLALALPITALQEQKIVDAFRGRNAVNSANARRLTELGLSDSKALRSLVAVAIVRKAGPERYFLDEKVWAGRRNLGGRNALRIAVVLVLIAAGALLYLAGK